MAMQDLTPQLRTRLSRVEKVVGWFVTIATLLLLAGLAFYIYSVAQNKGWFKTKAPYFLTLRSGGGLQPGDKVMLMGAPVGEVTKVDFFPPDAVGNVYVAFVVYEPNYGYVWDDSYVRVNSAGFLGQRYLEIIKGGTSGAKDLHATYKEESGRLVAQWSRDRGEFVPWRWGNEPYELDAYEPPELGTQLDEMVQTVKVSLTNILALTNDLARTLSGAATATENLNELLAAARPLVTNATIITENLTPPRGSLGEWLIPTNMAPEIATLLTNANLTVRNVNLTVTNANTNLVAVFSNTIAALGNVAGITSNLFAQVEANNNILSGISRLVVDADDLVQGLKRHWLLRSAFKDRGEEERRPERDRPAPPRSLNPKGAGRE